MPAPRIPDETRAAILADIKAGAKSCRAIARDHSVSAAYVSKLAKDEIATDAFERERSRTEKGTRARAFDARAARAQLAADLLADAQELRQRARSPYTYYERGSDGPELVTLPLPPLRDTREAYVAIGIALQRHLELERHDSDNGVEGAKSMLGALADALRVAAGPAPEE